mgnify:CR=1 FL=1
MLGDDNIEYTILDDDTICAIRGPWDEFAAENDAASLDVSSVLGRPLWEYISGEEVRAIYRVLLHRVRTTGKRVSFPFHCDSPGRVRLFRMAVSRPGAEFVRFSSTLLRSQDRPAVPLLDVNVPRSREVLLVCSVCKLFRCGQDWVPVERALAALGVMEGGQVPSLSHGLCPDCLETMLQSIVRPAE